MKLKYNNEIFQIENKVIAINEVFEQVNKVLEKKDTVFSHLLIDNVDIYENHEEYIKKNIEEIETIEIITRNVKEMIWETMESLHSYLQRAIPALTDLVNESYENFSQRSWDGINQLAEGMQWILQFMEIARNASQQPNNWEELEKALHLCETSFAQLLDAVEERDTILILDILSYEVTPAYETLEKNLAISLDDEEYLKNVN